MDPQLPCQSCSGTFSLAQFLENCWNSEPKQQRLLFTCPHCGEETKWELHNNALVAGESQHSLSEAKLKFFSDPTYGIDFILAGRLYHVPKKKPAPAGLSFTIDD